MKKIFFILIALLILNCKNNKDVGYSLVKGEEIEFQREKNKRDYFNFQYYVDSSENEFLICKVQDDRSIYFHKLTGELSKKIDIPFEDKIFGFYYINDTSIYFIPKYSFRIYEKKDSNIIKNNFVKDINELAILMEKYDLNNYFEFFPNPIAPFLVNNDKLYVPNAQMVNTDYSLKDSRPLLIFNKDSLHIESRVGRYPNTMIKKNKSIFPFDKSIAYTLNNKNQVVCSYAADHSIYVYDSISLINKFTCESKFIDYLPEFIDNKEVTNAKKMNDRFNQLPSYFGIYYDKYRNVYYRPVKHENKTKNKFGSQNVNEFKYSIMILDENFKVVGEQIFDSKDHLMYYIIITKSGILLKSPDDLSGKTRFTLFTLNENN